MIAISVGLSLRTLSCDESTRLSLRVFTGIESKLFTEYRFYRTANPTVALLATGNAGPWSDLHRSDQPWLATF